MHEVTRKEMYKYLFDHAGIGFSCSNEMMKYFEPFFKNFVSMKGLKYYRIIDNKDGTSFLDYELTDNILYKTYIYSDGIEEIEQENSFLQNEFEYGEGRSLYDH